MEREKKRFPAVLDQLGSMITFVHEQALKSQFDESGANQLQLAAEEAVVNIITYAYADQESPGELEIDCERLSEGGIEITFTDYGVPFNPLTGKKPIESGAPVDDRKIGGLGLHMISHLTDEVSYSWKDGANIFSFRKGLQEEYC